MSMPSSDRRPRPRDIVRGNAADFQRTWDTTEASSGFDPLPPGVYRCLISDGRLFTSKTNATPGFKIEFQVIDPPHAGRKVWHDVWLSSKALSMAKGELAKLGIKSPDQLEQPLPPGLIADVTVVQRTDDYGAVFNRVKTFKVVESDVPADDYRPDDDRDGKRSEGAVEHPAAGHASTVPPSLANRERMTTGTTPGSVGGPASSMFHRRLCSTRPRTEGGKHDLDPLCVSSHGGNRQRAATG